MVVSNDYGFQQVTGKLCACMCVCTTCVLVFEPVSALYVVSLPNACQFKYGENLGFVVASQLSGQRYFGQFDGFIKRFWHGPESYVHDMVEFGNISNGVFTKPVWNGECDESGWIGRLGLYMVDIRGLYEQQMTSLHILLILLLFDSLNELEKLVPRERFVLT